MRCPVCKREFDQATSKALPFCSDRCRLIDLGRWLDGKYQIPVVDEDESLHEASRPAEQD